MPPVTGSSPRFRDTARKSHDNGCEGPCVASWFHYALCLLIKMSRFSWPHGRAPRKRAEHTRGLSVLGSKTKINLKHAQGSGGGRGALPTPRQSHRGRPAPVPRDPQLPTASRQALRALSSVCRVPDLQPLTKTQPPRGKAWPGPPQGAGCGLGAPKVRQPRHMAHGPKRGSPALAFFQVPLLQTQGVGTLSESTELSFHKQKPNVKLDAAPRKYDSGLNSP